MKICPSCREEFLDHIDLCTSCAQKLVSDFEALPKSSELIDKEALLQGETIPLLEGPIAQCRELEKILIKASISCAVYPVSLTCDSHGQTLGSACDMKYMILIRPDDLTHAREAIESQFLATVAKEGQGEASRHVINLEDEQVTCPACFEVGPLNNGECAACGLVLGAPEEAR
jgi:hypothetical protein